jgi:hypothetical protein
MNVQGNDAAHRQGLLATQEGIDSVESETSKAGLQLGGVTEKLGGVTKFNGVTTFLTLLSF